MPLDDISSTYTQTVDSSKNYTGIKNIKNRLLWLYRKSPSGAEWLALTQEPISILAETILLTLTT